MWEEVKLESTRAGKLAEKKEVSTNDYYMLYGVILTYQVWASDRKRANVSKVLKSEDVWDMSHSCVVVGGTAVKA